MALGPGDHFLVVVQEGVILYARILPSEELQPQLRRVNFHSEMYPKGDEDVVDLHMADLPMTKCQFRLAKTLSWPGNVEVMKMLMSMGRPARA
jgi:hypothetical protein